MSTVRRNKGGIGLSRGGRGQKEAGTRPDSKAGKRGPGRQSKTGEGEGGTGGHARAKTVLMPACKACQNTTHSRLKSARPRPPVRPSHANARRNEQPHDPGGGHRRRGGAVGVGWRPRPEGARPSVGAAPPTHSVAPIRRASRVLHRARGSPEAGCVAPHPLALQSPKDVPGCEASPQRASVAEVAQGRQHSRSSTRRRGSRVYERQQHGEGREGVTSKEGSNGAPAFR